MKAKSPANIKHKSKSDWLMRPVSGQLMQRAAVNAAQDAVPPIVYDVLRSPGQPLDAVTSAFMEPRFGHDFSQVRVHTDANAAASAQAVNALAYTAGPNVVFGAGQYKPNTGVGCQLMAHELTHVLQQHGSTHIGSGIVAANHSTEQEADTIAKQVTNQSSHQSAPLQVTSARGVQRLAGPEIPVTPEQIAQMRTLFHEINVLLRTGAVATEEATAITAAVAEAEAAIVTAGEVAAAGATATTVGEGALATAAGLAADDVTGVGVADDIAIPFVLLAAAAGFGIGYLIGNSADEIAVAWRKAAESVGRAVDAMRRSLARPRTQTQTQTQTETQTQTKRRTRQCKNEPCEQPLPIAWPTELPDPTTVSPRMVIRMSRGDLEWEGIERGEPQRMLSQEIQEARNRLIPPPQPCFGNDAEPNAPYDAHHIHPLYIGGEDALWNLCAIETGRHHFGHQRLDNQTPFLLEYQACGICSPFLSQHPVGQMYQIVASK